MPPSIAPGGVGSAGRRIITGLHPGAQLNQEGGDDFEESRFETLADGGTPLDRLMATWGRATEIELGFEDDEAFEVRAGAAGQHLVLATDEEDLTIEVDLPAPAPRASGRASAPP